MELPYASVFRCLLDTLHARVRCLCGLVLRGFQRQLRMGRVFEKRDVSCHSSAYRPVTVLRAGSVEIERPRMSAGAEWKDGNNAKD